MPAFAQLNTDVRCNVCDCTIPGPVSFQWGEIPSRYESLGAQVRWAEVDGHVIRPFSLFSGHRWNFGDPSEDHVIVLDADTFAPDSYFECPSCSTEVYALVHIRRNVLAELQVISREELQSLFGSYLGKAECITVDADGTRHVRDDFWDRTVLFKPGPPSEKDLL